MRVPMLNDMHVHLRQGDLLTAVVGYTAERCHHALAMPNTDPPILSGLAAAAYKKFVMRLRPDLELLVACKLTPGITVEDVRLAKEAGVVAFKLYPDGITTNSDGGIPTSELTEPTVEFLDVLDEIEHLDLVLCLHGEMPGEFCLDRESKFLPFVTLLRSTFPSMRVVFEHVTTAEAIQMVTGDQSGKLAATVTLHHLYLTLDDVVGDQLRPHNFCKPIAKRRHDRDILRSAALSDHPNVFFGSDSAPHLRSAKESACGCAGVFTAPLALELLVELFDQYGKSCAEFGTHRAARFYRLGDEVREVEVVKESWDVPDEIAGVVPFLAGERIGWRLR